MEARTEYKGSEISKGLIAVVAVSITLALGVSAGVVAKNLTAPAARAPQTHISQGLGGAAQDNPARRGGTQIVGGSAAPTAAPDETPVARGMRPGAHI